VRDRDDLYSAVFFLKINTFPDVVLGHVALLRLEMELGEN
jgi:hypothetical protein